MAGGVTSASRRAPLLAGGWGSGGVSDGPGAGLSHGIRTDDPDELIRQAAELADGNVDAPSETHRIAWVVCAGYDGLVRLALPMKASEVGMIVG